MAMSPDDAIAVWSSGKFEFLDDHDPHKTKCTMDGKSQIVQLVEEGLILRGQCQATFVHQPPPRHHHATTTQPLCHHAQQKILDAFVHFPSPPPTPLVPKNIYVYPGIPTEIEATSLKYTKNTLKNLQQLFLRLEVTIFLDRLPLHTSNVESLCHWILTIFRGKLCTEIVTTIVSITSSGRKKRKSL